jgi:hypothetical protein
MTGAGGKPILYIVRALPGARLERLAELFDVRGNAPRSPPRDRLVEEAALHIRSFDWSDVARQTAAVYADLVRDRVT